MSDTLLTVAQVAIILKVSQDTVVRRFAKVPGVVNLSTSRRYRVLRIPKTVLEKFLAIQSGHSVHIHQVPELPARRHKSPTWQNRAVLNLAKAGLQNECKDKKMYRRIAERAYVLAATNVSESLWPEIDWFWDDEEDQNFEE